MLSFLKSCTWLPVNLGINFRYILLVSEAPSFPSPQYISVSYETLRLPRWSSTGHKKRRKKKEKESAVKLMKLFKAVCVFKQFPRSH